VIFCNLAKIMVIVSMTIVLFVVITVHVHLVSMVQYVSMIIDLVNQILVGIMVGSILNRKKKYYLYIYLQVPVMRHPLQHLSVDVRLVGKEITVKQKLIIVQISHV
jgi:hypothetical protein